MNRNEIKLPGPTGPVVKIINHDEHHMSAFTIEFRFPFPVEHQSRYFTTNGQAFLSRDGVTLFVWDSSAILKINGLSSGAEFYGAPPQSLLYQVTERDDGLHLMLTGPGGYKDKLSLTGDDVRFHSGCGPVIKGLFPSAFRPHVERILQDGL
jgi:hypothetical protein